MARAIYRRCASVVALIITAACSRESIVDKGIHKVIEFHLLANTDKFSEIVAGSEGNIRKDAVGFSGFLRKNTLQMGKVVKSSYKTNALSRKDGENYLQLLFLTRYQKGCAWEQYTFHVASGNLILYGYKISPPTACEA